MVAIATVVQYHVEITESIGRKRLPEILYQFTVKFTNFRQRPIRESDCRRSSVGILLIARIRVGRVLVEKGREDAARRNARRPHAAA